MKNLTEVLDYLEDHIDGEHQEKVEKLHLDAMAFREIPYVPITTIFDPPDVKMYNYSEAFDDPEKMLFNELIHTVAGTGTLPSVMAKDHMPLHVRSNHGVGIISSLFGANCRIINNMMPYVDEMKVEDLKKAIANGVPDLNKALPAKVAETIQYYRERLKEYPRCEKYIHITQPDLQGPFDVAHLLLGTEIYYLVYDDPDFLNELLAVITDTCIAYLKSLDGKLNDAAGEDAIYIHGDIYGGHTLIKDDSAIINISEDMYNEFSKPYNEKILGAVGGGSLHYCGGWKTWHNRAMDNKWLRSVNYGNPEKQDLKGLYDYWAPRKISNIMWGDGLRLERLPGFDFSDQLKELGIKTGMSIALRVKDLDEAKRMIEKHTGGIDL